ncbi:hypothetical protein [Klebsiella pneumoniae]
MGGGDEQGMAMAGWGEELDEAGMSLVGVARLEKLTERMWRSVC